MLDRGFTPGRQRLDRVSGGHPRLRLLRGQECVHSHGRGGAAHVVVQAQVALVLRGNTDPERVANLGSHGDLARTDDIRRGRGRARLQLDVVRFVTGSEVGGDLNRDGMIDLLEVALLAGNWLVSLP